MVRNIIRCWFVPLVIKSPHLVGHTMSILPCVSVMFTCYAFNEWTEGASRYSHLLERYMPCTICHMLWPTDGGGSSRVCQCVIAACQLAIRGTVTTLSVCLCPTQGVREWAMCMVRQNLTMRGAGLMFTAVVVESASEEENSDRYLVNA